MDKIQKPTVEQLDEFLKKIGFTVRGRYPNLWIADYEGKRTNYRVMDDRIEIDEHGAHYMTAFHFKDCELELLEEGDAVSIAPIGSPNSAFALFMNHTISQKPE